MSQPKPMLPNTSGHPTGLIQDYLSAIYVMERDGQAALPAQLARAMGVAPPTVTATLQRMVRDGWLKDAPKGVMLTPEGRRQAQAVVRRHMLVEWMLSRFLKMPMSRLHHEAHRLEHAVSGEMEERLAEQLGHPTLCPHGNPFPGKEGGVKHYLSLHQAATGARFTIRRLHERAEETPGVLEWLETRGLVPPCEVEITGHSEVNASVELTRGGRAVSVSDRVADLIYGEPAG